MGFVNDWISGCSNVSGGFLGAISILFAKIFNGIFLLIYDLIFAILKQTILSSNGDQTVASDVFTAMHSLDAVAMALLIALLIWSVLTAGEQLMTTSKWDGWQGLVGRAGSAFLWIAGSYFAVSVLLHVNALLTSGFTNTLSNEAKTFAVSCHQPTTILGIGIAGAATAFVFLYPLVSQTVLLAIIFGMAFALAQWLFRLVEILLWGSLLPLAAATIVAEPSRKTFQYVWSQLQGAIFTQSAMALGIWLIFGTALHGENTTSLLNMLIGAAGFFMVGKIPRYLQEARGHTSSGGFDVAKGAMAIMMARGGEELMAATPLGQAVSRGFENHLGKSQTRLSTAGGVTGRLWHGMGQSIATHNARANFDQARYDANSPGAMAMNAAATNIRNTAQDRFGSHSANFWGEPFGGFPNGSGSGPRSPNPYGGGGLGGIRGPSPTGPGPAFDEGPIIDVGYTAQPADAAFATTDAGFGSMTDSASALGPVSPVLAEAGDLMNVPAGSLTASPLSTGSSVMDAAYQTVPEALSYQELHQRLNPNNQGKYPPVSADQFARSVAPMAQNYLKNVVYPNMALRYAHQPQKLQEELKRVQDMHNTFATGPVSDIKEELSRLSGYSKDQFGNVQTQRLLFQELAAAEVGGTVANRFEDDGINPHFHQPENNRGIMGEMKQLTAFEQALLGPPGKAQQRLHELKNSSRDFVDWAGQAATTSPYVRR
ncbi:hypothetical protein [Sulfobacillus thermosulfidooxidans]|uniref:hypothetical protein n=1 Tax=Sulfobacillus thermosulfidooxidans TaxID=28034 RepID=UPI0006B4B530|nr:hypothetical protein [Sulfobacillus thermosulfidooxidans]